MSRLLWRPLRLKTLNLMSMEWKNESPHLSNLPALRHSSELPVQARL